MSVWSDHGGDMKDSYFGNSVRCYAFLADTDLCFRVNTVTAFCEASRLLPRIIQALLPVPASFRYVHANATLIGKAQVGADSIVGERTVIQDKVSIKKSVIGPNCKISEKAKISGCTIMNDVFIGESCNLQNCIIASQAQIGDKSDLKDCLVGQQFEVPVSSKHSSDTLTDGERLMEY
ncbi:translation initiation factor eIF-2B subunit gamma-like isoform X1 [Paramacrobiotus metropolitanus]|uniref:translation initiation factor eIF-2B subunit gamma-like isoform X1 n=1 Tax=Paramacrobiotus metropolitanus TaxID=2943436 RepID=UPI0024456A05|nr:translation initiation factor eIF-2B subunit gamma-like isoform X1 [Paramacrobiotus metropolitanus]